MPDQYTPRHQSLHRLLRSPISDEMIDYVTWKAMSVIPCALPSPPMQSSDYFVKEDNNRPMQFLSTEAPMSPHANAPIGNAKHFRFPDAPAPLPGQVQVPPLRDFIAHLAQRSSLHTGTFLATLVYLERLRKRLNSVARGMPCTCHRVFLATLIVTAKYVNDTSPKNRHWARYSSVFSVAEVNLMEKQLLLLLDFHLSITIDELLNDIDYFLLKDAPPSHILHHRSFGPDVAGCSSSCDAHRYSMPISLEWSPTFQSYLADASDDDTPRLTDSSYSSDDFNKDIQSRIPPMTDLVAPPPASYRQLGTTSIYDEPLSYNSNNPYRMQNDRKPYRVDYNCSPSMYAAATVNQLSNARNYDMHR